MAINKNFVIKNGAEINTKLLVADADTQKVGIGTTRPSYTLHVMGPGDNTGGIGATYIYTTGITTTQALNVLGVSTFNAGPILLARGEQTGTPSQSLQVGTATTVSGAYISGNLGLANTNPTSTLHVVGNALITGVTTISGGISLPQGADLARLRVTGITTLGQTNTTGLSNAGVSTLGDATASTAVVTGFSTLGGASATLLNVSGIATVAGGFNATQGGDLARLRVTGITTLGDATSASIVISGVSTLSGGLNASQGADLARLRVTGITTLGQTNTTGLSNAGVSTLGNATASTLVVSGFSTLGSVSAANLGLAGITTGLNAPGISTFGDTIVSDLFIAGITTGLNASGISTLTSLTGTNVNYSGIGTIANLRATNANVSGVTTTDSLNVNSSFNVFAPNAIFSNDVTINGNLSIGGTSTIINAASLIVEDKDLVLGFTTSQLPTDTTANHGGIAVASTEGTPLVTFAVSGINTLPATYKQIMWVKSNTMGAGTTDAWLFNYSVGIGSTLVPNNVRLAVGAVQVTEDAINARVGNLTHVRSTNINATGITTTNSLSIDATQVISSARQLQNIASLDATTTATIEAAISNAPNTFTDLNVTGFSTLAAVSAGNLALAGITTGLNVPGIGTVGFIQHTTLNVSGFSTLGAASATLLNVSGVSTFTNGPVLIGSGTSTGTASQPLQVTGGGYVSGNLGVGMNNPERQLHVYGTVGVGSTGASLAVFGTKPLFGNSTAGAYGAVNFGDWSSLGTPTIISFSSRQNATGNALYAVNSGEITKLRFTATGTDANTGMVAGEIVASTVDLNYGNSTTSEADLLFKLSGSGGDRTTPVTRMVIKGSGNVGVGTTNPGAKLDVIGDIRLSGGLNASQGADLARLRVTGITTLGQANITGLSNAGISTLGDATASTLVVSGVTTVSAGTTSAPAITPSGDNNTGIFFPSADTVAIGEGGAEVLRVDSSGAVGIRTNSPNSNSVLDVNGSQWIVKNASYNSESSPGLYIRGNRSNGTVGLLLGADNTTGIAYIQPLVAGTTYSQNMSICAMGGNVGIGLTNPQEKLSISGTVQRDATINGTSSAPAEEAGYIYKLRSASVSQAGLYFLNQYNNDNGTWMSFKTTSGSNVLTTALTIDSLARTGIGSTTPTSKLDVAGDVKVIGIVTATGGFNLGIQTNGVNVTTGVVTALNFVGTGNTITYNAGTKTVSINIAGSAGGGGGGGVTEIKTSGISTTNPIGVGSFATASFRSASVVAQINQNAQYQVGRYLMIHDGTTVTVVEEGAVSTGSSMLGTFTGAIVGSNAELRVSLALPQSTAGVATVTTKIDTITL